MEGRVLVVDDNSLNLKLSEAVLSSEGYDVHTTKSAEEALNAMATFSPDVVLTDIELPGIDGLELARRLKGDRATRHVVILALSGHVLPEHREAAMAAGCDGYVTKPIDTEELPRTVADHIARARGEGV